MYSSDEYDSNSESDMSCEYDILDIVSIDDIIDLYYYFAERFALMPFFLHKMKSTNLTDITYECLNNTIECYIENMLEYYDSRKYQKFLDDYSNEILISYQIYTNFLRKYKSSIELSDWEFICYKYTVTKSY